MTNPVSPMRPGTIPDGEGTITKRAAAWNLVQRAQRDVNATARAIGGLCGEISESDLAAHVVSLTWEVRALDDARKAYLRIGGAPDRAPGEGGIA